MQPTKGRLAANFFAAALLASFATTPAAATTMTFAVTLDVANASGAAIGNVHVGIWGPVAGSLANGMDIVDLTALADIPTGSSSIGFTVTMDPAPAAAPTVFSLAGTTAGGEVILSFHPLTVSVLAD